MTLDVLICTLNKGIEKIPSMLLSPRQDVAYVISWQYTDDSFLILLPQELKHRTDVSVHPLQGKGLSRNRNNALAHAQGDICLISDDDVRYFDSYFDTILQTFQKHPEVDIAQFRYQSYDGKWMKAYPPKSYQYDLNDLGCIYPSSIELAMKRDVWQRGLRFNTLFGLGADYLASGEEDVLLADACRSGMIVQYFPYCIAQSDPDSTGIHFSKNIGIQRAKGAVFYKRFGFWKALYRCTREGTYWLVHKRCNPFPLWMHMLQGILYIQKKER